MSCPFCESFACYERQLDRRLRTGTLAMSEENARLLVHLADQIRTATRATLRLVEHEAVPTIVCDLFDGFAEGLMEELCRKLVPPRERGITMPISLRIRSLPPESGTPVKRADPCVAGPVWSSVLSNASHPEPAE